MPSSPRIFVVAAVPLASIVVAALLAVTARETLYHGSERGTSCADSLAANWIPEQPVRGALFRVLIRGLPDSAVPAGEAAGERLHFRPGPAGQASAIAAIPIDARDSVELILRCDGDTLLRPRIGVAAGDYVIEKLRVAPAFGRPPDSATAARIERESRRAAGVAAAAHDTPMLWDSAFVHPREARITSGFGNGREFNGSITSRHMGTDFAGATGAPVRAANRGVVRIVDAFYYGGNVIYIDHGAGLSTAYLHLSRQIVAVGDTVERGQVIGRVGATGRVTGPHLHLIVRYGSVTVDPMSLFALRGDGAGQR